jgi:hypothetical protein
MAGSVGGPARIAHRSVKVIRYAIVALLIVGIGGALVLEATGQFFVLGSVMLLAALGWVAMRLYAAGQPVRTAGVLAIARLGVRNASRNGSRSLLTVGLVAFATFVIVAIGANRRDENAPERLSKGSWIVAESSVPLLYDLNTAEGRRDLGIPDDNGTLVKDARVYRLRAKQGEDASCLNLYQPKSPRILGIPDSTLRELHFVLGGSQADFPGSQAIQHKLLQTELGTDVIPAMGDANSVRWILHLGLGDRLPITADDGRNMELQIVSLLDRSVFQSELIISESNFQRLFPSQVGYSVFMIDPRQSTTSGPPGHDPAMPRVGTMLEEYLSDYGFDVNLVAERVAEYHAVENTYLATFQLLGGLGLMLGTLGLGAVVLRGVIERRGELALLMAVGYRSRDLAWMVLAETAYLLIAGLVVGSISAAVAVAPHLYQYRFEVPWGSLVITLLLVLAAGLLSSTAAVLATVRTPLLPALRSE